MKTVAEMIGIKRGIEHDLKTEKDILSKNKEDISR
jgi:hypothetical protein